MGQICSYAGSIDDVIKRKVGNIVKVLKKKGQWLTDSTGCSKDSNLTKLIKYQERQTERERESWEGFVL